MSTAAELALMTQDSELIFLTKYTALGASSRYRTLQYLPFLPQNLQYKVEPLFDDNYLKSLYTNGRKPLKLALQGYAKRLQTLDALKPGSTIILENELWPYLPYALEESFLQKSGRLVLIYDDAIFHNYDQSGNLWLKANKNKIGKLMAGANCIIAGNKYLANYAKKWNNSVELIPTVIDETKYLPAKQYLPESYKLKIVWVGSPATANYLNLLSQVWQNPWVQKNCELTLIGAGQINIDGIQVNNLPWEAAKEVNQMQHCDVGIMPLPDTPWTWGKCGFKLIQYMAAGLPCVASPIGANCEIVIDNETGFLATNATQWIEKLKLFFHERYLIEQMGRAGKKRVLQNYTLQATAQHWLKLILG
jgi:hypothetical protein